MHLFANNADIASWHDFFEGAASAAAALSGLIFVAVSLNLGAILAEEKKIGSSYLTGRALESLVALFLMLGISLVGLDPTILQAAFAGFVLIVAAGTAASPIRAVRAFQASNVKPIAYNLRLVLALTLVAVYFVSSLTLVLGVGGGLTWLVPAFLLAITIAVTNAWILLVEVLR